MHKTVAEALGYVTALLPQLAELRGCDIAVAPVFTALSSVAAAAGGAPLQVFAQDVAAEGPTGAFTGEVSAEMVKEAGCQGALIGHSERRRYYGETDAVVSAKTRRALDAGLLPIVCLGETLAERESGAALEVVERQLRAIADALTEDDARRIVIAYEPVWAIGTGRAATPEIAQAMHRQIRSVWEALFGAGAALRVLYGGSVTAENVADFTALPDVDGALVGGASLSPLGFAQLIRQSQAGAPARQAAKPSREADG